MTERIDNPAHPPAVFVGNLRYGGSTRTHRPVKDGIGIIDHQQSPARCAADGLRAEAAAARPCRCHPECGIANGQLRDDIVSLTDAVQNGCAKRHLVEGNRRTGAVEPQLRLDIHHAA